MPYVPVYGDIQNEHRGNFMKRLVLLLTLFGSLGIVATAQSVYAAGRQWKLVKMTGSQLGTGNAYLEFGRDLKRMTGNAGCNRMFGGVELSGRRIVFSNIGTTRMECTDVDAQRTEIALLTALKSVDRFRQTGTVLELLQGEHLLLRFVANQNSNSVQLEDKKWRLESIGNGPVSKLARTAFVAFDKAKASMGGDSSCNVFGGSYTTSGSTLRINDIMSTMRACVEDDRMEIERKFLNGLRTSNRYTIANGKLRLYQDDRLLLTMTGETK